MCKFGIYCRYKHSIPKDQEIRNNENIENKVENQAEDIRRLKSQLNELETRFERLANIVEKKDKLTAEDD